MISDFLSESEVNDAKKALRELDTHPWAAGLVRSIDQFTLATKDRLFELRFARELARARIQPSHETRGEGSSTLDFGFASGTTRFEVELMRLNDTGAATSGRAAWTDEDGDQMESLMLRSDAADQKLSEEGETLKAIERICGKCHNNGQPAKFREPDGQVNVLMIDMRRFLPKKADRHDLLQIAFGAHVVPPVYRRYWDNRPIEGVFSTHNRCHGAETLRARVHALCFVNETSFRPGLFARACWLVGNPVLLRSAGLAQKLRSDWPLRPANCLACEPRD